MGMDEEPEELEEPEGEQKGVKEDGQVEVQEEEEEDEKEEEEENGDLQPEQHAQKQAEAPKKRRLSTFKSCRERNVWSAFNPMWVQCKVNKPRMPTAEELKSLSRSAPPKTKDKVKAAVPLATDEDWTKKHHPTSLKAFLCCKEGVNLVTCRFLQDAVQHKALSKHVVLSGGAYSGKAAFAKVFVRDFMQAASMTEAGMLRFVNLGVCHVGHQEVDDSKALMHKVARFMKRSEVLAGLVPRFLIVANAENIITRGQQTLCSLMDTYGSSIRIIMLTSNHKKMTNFLKERTQILRVTQVGAEAGLRIGLDILHAESVGYELPGIEAAFHKAWPNLRKFVAILRTVFLRHLFVSLENLRKVIPRRGPAPVPQLTPLDALRPIPRCNRCTLPPPCQHISEEELIAAGIERRAALPQRDSTCMDCPPFVGTGACRVFNNCGACSLHHPLHKHEVHVPAPRCTVCSIRRPCNLCAYDKMRTRLLMEGTTLTSSLGQLSDQVRTAAETQRLLQSSASNKGPRGAGAAKKAPREEGEGPPSAAEAMAALAAAQESVDLQIIWAESFASTQVEEYRTALETVRKGANRALGLAQAHLEGRRFREQAPHEDSSVCSSTSFSDFSVSESGRDSVGNLSV